MDLDAWIEKVRKCEFLAEDELKALCEYVRRYGYLWLLALSLSCRFVACASGGTLLV